MLEPKMTGTFVTFLLVLGICQANFTFENINDKKVDLNYRLPSGLVKPTEYKLHLTPDLVKFTFDGEVDIRFIALVTSNTLMLNVKDLTIYDVKFVDLNTTKTLGNKYEKDEEHEILKIRVLPQYDIDHHYSLQIKYEGILNNRSRGFYRSRVTERNIVVGYAATTQFEPTNARLAFPCWDEPIYKAKFNISLTHDKTYKAISNMDVLKTEEKNGMVTTTFKQTPPMSTYLVAFVVSKYRFKGDQVGNFTYRVWTKRVLIRHTDFALQMSRPLLEQLNLYTNISYQTYMPDKIDQVTQKDFPAGAMENWGLVIYREFSLLYDPSATLTRRKMKTLTIIAHEFTHQWFGDLVTPKWWKYLWLNEGFATYFQFFIANKVVPEMRLNEVFVVEGMQDIALIVDSSPTVRPMNHDVSSPKEIKALFDGITYQKAGSIIRMMSHAMTEEVFHKGIKYYLASHAFGNVDSNNLFESFQKAMDESGIKWDKPVNVIMHNWVEEPGYPVLTVRRLNEVYQLKQERFLAVKSKMYKPFSQLWWIPITVVEESNPNFNNTTPAGWFYSFDTSHIVPSKQKSGWFIFNTQQTGYYRVNYYIENWELLMKELNKGNRTKIHVLNRAQMADDALSLARADHLNYSVALNVSLYLKHESDYIPWRPAFRHLDFLRDMLRTSKKFYTFTRYVTYLLRTITKDVGYKPKANDSDLVKMLRVDAMRWACEVGIKNCTDYAEATYQHWLINPQMKVDVDLKKEILCAGVRNAIKSEWDRTLEYITAFTDDEDNRKDQLEALACSNSTDMLWRYLNSTLNPNYPVNFQTAATNVVSRYPTGPQLVFNFLVKEYDRIQKIPDYETVMCEVTVAIAGSITSQHQYLIMTEFLKQKNLTKFLKLVVEKVTPNLMWAAKYKPAVDKWLGENSGVFERPDSDSASTMAVASFLVIFSLFISRFY